MATWLNEDGLYLKFGRSEGVSVQDGGAFCTYGPEIVAELILNLVDLDQDEDVQNDVLIIPDNALITKVVVTSLVTAATGTAFDLGLIHTSRDTGDSEFTADPNGLWEAFITAELAVGEQTVGFRGPDGLATIPDTNVGSTPGALIGTVTTAPTLITASRTDATAFTAGKVHVAIHYMPKAVSN